MAGWGNLGFLLNGAGKRSQHTGPPALFHHSPAGSQKTGHVKVIRGIFNLNKRPSSNYVLLNEATQWSLSLWPSDDSTTIVIYLQYYELGVCSEKNAVLL